MIAQADVVPKAAPPVGAVSNRAYGVREAAHR